MGFADPDAKLGFGYTMNQMAAGILIDPRATALIDAAYQSLDPARHYRVTVNDFLANGGDDFTLFKQFGSGDSGPLDREALSQYLQAGSAAPSTMPARIVRADGPGSLPCTAP